jgi:cell division protein FtsL
MTGEGMKTMIVRLLNTVFVGLAAVAVLANYHIAERTRMAKAELSSVERQIAEEEMRTAELQAKYVELARPDRIQAMAEAGLGMSNRATVQLSSLEMLPRRDEARVREVNAPAGASMLVKIAVRPGN